MAELRKISFDKNALPSLKRVVTNGRPYSHRIGLGFAIRLLMIHDRLREDLCVLDVLDRLEGLNANFRVREPAQFRYAPLSAFWHTHYVAPRHLRRNIAEHWGLPRQGNRKLDAMLRSAACTDGHDPDRWHASLAHKLVMQGYEQRARRGLTGDWIIFGRYEGMNYYLDLATHDEGEKGDSAYRLYKKLHSGSHAEFPFLFKDAHLWTVDSLRRYS